MANEAVLKYLMDTNRPYSCVDVTANLRGAFSKGVVQKALDALSESEKIRCKLYGKQKVYAAIQIDDVKEESGVEDFENQSKILSERLTEKTNELRTAENNLKILMTLPKTDAAKTQIEDINKRILEHQNKLEKLKSSTEIISSEEKKGIMNEHEKLVKEYRKRKRISTEMLEAILEGYPKSKKTLLDELCIETDEMVDFKLMGN